MTTKQEAGLFRGLMAALAGGVLILAVHDVRSGLFESRDWPMPVAFLFVPAALWLVAAWRFGDHLRRWRQLLLTGSLAYLGSILATIVTMDLTGDHLDRMQLAGVALATAVLLALPIAGLSAAKLAGMEGNYDEAPRPWIGVAALLAGAFAVISSLFLRMGPTGWEFLRRENYWVTARYGSASWLKSSVDWVLRCDYVLVLVVSVMALALMVPAVRRGLSTRAQQALRHLACAAALLLVVDLYCGWTVFLSDQVFFPEGPFYLGLVTLVGAALWLLAVIGGAGSSPRAERVRVAMMWVLFPMVACDLGSILYLPELDMSGNICLLLGALATAYGVARLLRDAAPPPRGVLAAAA